MSATAILPEDPTILIVGTVQNESTVAQTLHDGVIASLEGASKQEAENSSTAAANANTHMVAQVTEEGMASASADETTFKQHDSAAQAHNALSHSAAATANESGAKAASLERVASIQIAVAEVETRKVLGTEEQINRTNAGVQAEMKATGAVIDEEVRKSAGTAQNLESELVASAEITTEAPKLG
ncbi:MAG: hypothetical protein COB14_03090 [Alphaproteobacteria bacterium]|nr:MAG: hypothetical protein COB14_03090 [Alphaproteobacteria bacterium]